MHKEITLDITIEEIFKLAPDSVIILENAGIKCTGCKARTDRTLSEVFKEAELEEEKEKLLLTFLNKLEQIETEKEPQQGDFEAKEVTHDGKVHTQIAGLIFTKSAIQNLEDLSEGKGLQIKLKAGGCSGFKYDYEFKEQPESEEKEYQLTEKLKIFMTDFTFSRSSGSIVEFKLGLHQSGLTIANPNRKRSCSCGSSIAF